MSKLLALVPWWAKGLVLLAVVGGIAVAINAYGNGRYQAGQAQVQARWDFEKLQAQGVAIKAQGDNATESQRRINAQQEALNDQAQILAAARADAAALRSERERLRSDLRTYVAAHRGGASTDSAAAPAGSPASDSLDVLADLFSRADDAAGELAQALDQSYAAGITCERAYLSLTPPQDP